MRQRSHPSADGDARHRPTGHPEGPAHGFGWEALGALAAAIAGDAATAACVVRVPIEPEAAEVFRR